MKVDDILTPTITTLTVEVKVLKIGRKQCTIAVFKQLPVKNIVKDGYDTLTVWGRVKYRDEWWVICNSHGQLIKIIHPKIENNFKGDFSKWISNRSFRKELRSWDYLFYDGLWRLLIAKEMNREYDFLPRTINKIDESGCIYHGYLDSGLEELKRIIQSWRDIEREFEAIPKWNAFVNRCRNSEQLFIAV